MHDEEFKNMIGKKADEAKDTAQENLDLDLVNINDVHVTDNASKNKDKTKDHAVEMATRATEVGIEKAQEHENLVNLKAHSWFLLTFEQFSRLLKRLKLFQQQRPILPIHLAKDLLTLCKQFVYPYRKRCFLLFLIS